MDSINTTLKKWSIDASVYLMFARVNSLQTENTVSLDLNGKNYPPQSVGTTTPTLSVVESNFKRRLYELNLLRESQEYDPGADSGGKTGSVNWFIN